MSSSSSSSSSSSNVASVEQQQPIARQNDEEAARLCNKWVKSGLTQNKAIQFLLKTLEDLGCSIPKGFISCRKCEQPQASGFGKILVEDDDDETASACGNVIRDFQSALELQEKQKDEKNAATTTALQIRPEIFVCQQYMENKTTTHKTIVHELIHAIDMCRTQMDPMNNCLHLACTEIRAENLSGECSFSKELLKGTMQQFSGHGAACVQRRALLSVRANPKCAARANEYVAAALPRCLRDNYPFERHPNQLQN